jgi:hypothetical protein
MTIPKISFRHVVRALILIPVISYLSYCTYLFIFNEMEPKYTDCGVVVERFNDDVPIKHGSRTTLILIIQFKEAGLRSIEVDPTTYYQRKKGAKVCFKLPTNVSFWYKLNMLTGLFTSFILLIISIFGIIRYAFGSNSEI